MFAWEIKNANDDHRLVTLSSIEKYRSLLGQVNIYTTPEEFVDQLVANKSLTTPYKSHDHLVEIAQLRLWQWQKYHRGRLNQNQNRIEIQFKSKLNQDQDQKLDVFLMALYGANYEIGAVV